MVSAVNAQEKINWMTWEEMLPKYRLEKKKIFVDLYTDWCGWCKRMDNSTFSDPIIAKYINEKFYPVKLNGERKEDLVFEGVTYKFVNQGRRGYHEFAAALAQKSLSYPSFIFLNEDLQVIQVIPGYKDAKTFEYILNFFGGDHYKKTPYTQFEKEFKSSF
jgi:uncharacterized protein YyaL (SSP411 family)